MTRGLPTFNLMGVLALAILCGFQWQRNRTANLEVHALERIRHEQAAKLQAQDTTAKGLAADLDGFRAQVTGAKTALQQTEEKATVAARALAQLTGERDQLKASVAEWARALAARDEQLKQLGAQLQQQAAGRNDVVTRFNDLGDKYNQVVKTLNERTRQFNELAQRYEKATAQAAAQ